ncbi:alpha/beta hydrolase family esterase [Pseudoroseomonas globiformis]|uniref:Alpha/beta hydrolase family esterase n=1 Tax=Teichococcus globiformis TaxID=2307229 RepID=A0ABV7FYS1_9PROT
MKTVPVAVPAHVLEATRLTQQGRLAEALRLLQGQARNEVAGAASNIPYAAPSVPTDGRNLRTFDVDTETGTVAEAVPPLSTDQWRKIGAGLRPTLSVPDRGPSTPPVLRNLLNRLKPDLSDLGRRSGAGNPSMHTAVPLPDGASFTMRSFSCSAGTRDYKLYIPGSYQGKPVPLVIMLHGCTQSPDDFAAGTRMNTLAEEQGFLVGYPAQSASANVQKCWNWFSPGDQERDRGEPALIAGITRQIMRDHAVDPARVYVAGLSAGGAAAAIMGEVYPDLFAAVGVHSGLACGIARDMPSAFAAMRGDGVASAGHNAGTVAEAQRRRVVSTIVFHADRDRTVHPVNGDQVVARAAARAGNLRMTVEHGEVAGGRAYSRTLHSGQDGETVLEQWVVHGGGHAWAGGSQDGSYTDPKGPDASREMLRFFRDHPLRSPVA